MNRIFLAEAKLQGYRTIKNLDVKLNPGLNIIIGKNGSGKTNFITFLNDALTYNHKNLINSKTELTFAGRDKFELLSDKTIDLNMNAAGIKEFLSNDNGKFTFKYKGKSKRFNSIAPFEKEVDEKKLTFLPILLPHGLRSSENNLIIASPMSFTVGGTSVDESLMMSLNEENCYFLKIVCFDLFVEFSPIRNRLKHNPALVIEDASKIISNYFELQCELFNESINSYLPVQKIRINPSFNIYHDESNGQLKIENILLEYLVNDDWLPFSSLSDGTKRMFSLFADINVREGSAVLSKLPSVANKSKIILLEEPELGIHPHQLEQFMNFLKVASEDAQIIITTHSPQALDVLTKDTLSSLFICSHYPENGTTISNLNANQTEKAKAYMDEMYLSDYWRYSDLEK